MSEQTAQQRNDALEEFRARYGVTFTREMFSFYPPRHDGRFVLRTNNDDPLPPIGCMIRVYDYDGHYWTTVVESIDEAAGTFTDKIV